MSDIAPINSPGAAAYSTSPRTERPTTPTSSEASRGSDQVDLSSTARIFSQLNNTDGIRQELVARIRAEIEAGTYETPDKLDAAIEGLAQDLS